MEDKDKNDNEYVEDNKRTTIRQGSYKITLFHTDTVFLPKINNDLLICVSVMRLLLSH